MIIGPCPYEGCDGTHMIPIAPKPPCFSKEVCESCEREYWLKHSRWDPQAYTLEEFAAEFSVDETTKKVTALVDPAQPQEEV